MNLRRSIRVRFRSERGVSSTLPYVILMPTLCLLFVLAVFEIGFLLQRL